MFETLFAYPSVVRQYRAGPLAPARAMYLQQLAAKGMGRVTLRHRASYCLYLAKEIEHWPPDHIFNDEEIEALTSRRAAQRTGRYAGTGRPQEPFRFAATDFLRSIGRLRLRAAAPRKYESELADFITTQGDSTWSSAATRHSATWHLCRFLDYLEQRDIVLGDLTAGDVDAYVEHAAQRWNRNTLHAAGTVLRAWFAVSVHRERLSSRALPNLRSGGGAYLDIAREEI